MEPPVPEGYENEKRISQRYRPGKTALPGQQECGEKVNAEEQGLEPGTQPANCPVWEAAYRASIRK